MSLCPRLASLFSPFLARSLGPAVLPLATLCRLLRNRRRRTGRRLILCPFSASRIVTVGTRLLISLSLNPSYSLYPLSF